MALSVCTEQKQTIDWSDQKVNTITPGDVVAIKFVTPIKLMG